MNFAYGILVLPAGGFPPNHAQKLRTSTGRRGTRAEIKLRRHNPVPQAACEFGLMSTVP